MRRLGIIGGIGPESTVDYYRTIIALYRERKSDGSYPPLLINSIDMKRMLSAVQAGDHGKLIVDLLGELEKVQRAGADFALLASNTPHLVFDDLQRQSSLSLLSIVAATCEVAKGQGFKRVALFGTRHTMQGPTYRGVFSNAGIALVLPEVAEQEYIHDKYMNELVHAVFLPETRAGLLAIVDRLARDAGIDAVILGGTELPLILRDPAHNGIPFLNTTRIHCEAAVDLIFS